MRPGGDPAAIDDGRDEGDAAIPDRSGEGGFAVSAVADERGVDGGTDAGGGLPDRENPDARTTTPTSSAMAATAAIARDGRRRPAPLGRPAGGPGGAGGAGAPRSGRSSMFQRYGPAPV